MRFVVDASVGIKWFLNEVHSDLAVRFRDAHPDLHVPSLFDLELANIVWKRVRRGDVTLDEGSEIVSLIRSAAVVRHEDSPLLDNAFRFAATHDRSVYDSIYIALAGSLGCGVVTADERLHRSLLDQGVQGITVLLTEVGVA